MRLVVVFAIVSISLVKSSPISLGDEFHLPSVADIESHVDKLWTNFKKGYNVVYNTSVEELHRFNIFVKHVKMIVQHNIEHDLGLHTYRLGINKFATLVSRGIWFVCVTRRILLFLF